jgi:hypothetical protein
VSDTRSHRERLAPRHAKENPATADRAIADFSLEPAFFNAGEADADIERLSRKLGEQARLVRPHVRLAANTDGIIAIWGKVALEPLDATGTSELAAGRNPRTGILVDFLGNFGEAWTFIESLVVLVSSGRVALIPGKPFVSL